MKNNQEGAKEIGNQEYLGNRDIEKLVLPKGIEKIGNYAFANCINLTTVTLPEGLISIGEGAFAGCVSMETIVFPESLKEIGKEAFEDCSRLKKVTIPSGTMVAEDAFEGYTNLEITTNSDSKNSFKNRIKTEASNNGSITTGSGYTKHKTATQEFLQDK